MITFAIVSALLLLLSVIWWFKAVSIKPQQAQAEYRSLALEQINTFRLRLKELEYQREHEELDEIEFTGSVNELKRQLRHDLKAQEKSDKNKQFSLFLPGLLFLLVFVSAFYFTNGESKKLEDWQVAIEKLPELGKRRITGEGEPLTAKELQQFALALRTQIFEQGEDPLAWLVLGQVTLSLKDYDAALLAHEKAYNLDPNKVAILLSYAELLLMQGDAGSMHNAAIMLSNVLRQQPQNVVALFMVGYIAEQKQDWQQAKMSYDLLTKVLPPGDPRISYVQQRLAALQPAMAGEQGNEQKPEQAAQQSTPVLVVKLQLDEKVMDKVPTGGILFVYAKAAQGPPMPAAVVRMEQFSLPMNIELSDANAMMPDYKLSNLENVVIFARISKDGDIAVQSGELQGQTTAFSLKDTQEVSVVINQVL